ncbi:hypothetical protein BFU36_06715 [Sulfolobus sp. A20]|uniref:CBS domain-containing protein n=1 Tax=Sulfolobaceae TaxID=118883 RepID=UPI000845CF3C|nr:MULTISPECIES: CBS domain-containing protein [unclassified Sulfolobus]TRM77098.1 CBS domain-containing protein [Sulfolobus sp. A20-N-F8]TRM83147.1 CBS domain-containing protein [Sulfolobus sp. A20-N-F6]TRM87649.1 CBS domain-containing protein [Sulfolobus sp. C3]TRN00672.1 CBS domain-containing protein [Sulfolobus sp. E1]AOL16444.1 hypothetical protein BFU36_06715 [Sulfolobus sp. A20]
MKVKEVVIERVPILIEDSYTIKDALDMMRKGNTNFLLVTNKQGEIVGIVTQKLIIRGLSSNVSLSDNISKVMSRTIITVNGDEELLDIFVMMVKNNVNYVLVVNNSGRPISVLSLREVLYSIQKECDRE